MRKSRYRHEQKLFSQYSNLKYFKLKKKNNEIKPSEFKPSIVLRKNSVKTGTHADLEQ